MAKSTISSGFAKFAAKTTKGAYDEARKGERMGRGIPFPVGTTGTGVVSAVICDTTKKDEKTGEQHPRIRVEIKVETPEEGRGKTLSGPGLMQTIKDGRDPSKWSAQDAFSAALAMLEDCGLPEEISKGYKDFQECVDWFDEEPRYVNWEIEENNYTNRNGQQVNGKQTSVLPIVNEAGIPAADKPADEEEETDPDATYCKYRGGKHKVVGEDGDMLTIKGVNSGNIREVKKEDVELLD